jgi:hypothetical protein
MMRRSALLLLILCLAWAGGVHAAAGDSWFDQASAYTYTLSDGIAAALETPQVQATAQVILLICMVVSLFMLGMTILDVGGGLAAAMPAIVHTVVRIITVQILMLAYLDIAGAGYDFFSGIGRVLQTGLLGDPEPFVPLFRIFEVIERVSWESVARGRFDFLKPANIALAVAQLVVTAVMLVLGIITIWALWGFSILKLLGLFILPTLLVPHISKWAEAWLGLILSFLAYGVFAQVGASLAVWTILAGFAAIGIDPNTPGGIPIVVSSWTQIFPLIFFAAFSIFGMWKSVGMASHIFGGGIVLTQGLNNMAGFFARRFR